MLGKMFHWELYKKLNFQHTEKWYKQKREAVQENKTNKSIGEFKYKINC